MLCARGRGEPADLIDGRGDAFCGMLNASLNCGLRNLRAYIPPRAGRPARRDRPDGRALRRTSRAWSSASGISRSFTFGPRPQDFYACNAPIKPLYDLGVEVMENTELDMFMLFKSVANRQREIRGDRAGHGARNSARATPIPEKLIQLAQFELALTTFFEQNLGSRQYGVFANKCWPSFEKAFGFVPCYVNSRLATRGIPVACEVDIYGAVSRIHGAVRQPATRPRCWTSTTPSRRTSRSPTCKGAARQDLFMGFHCGNTPSCAAVRELRA